MTLTLRDIPLDLDIELQRRAAAEHRPVDQVAVELLQAGLGLAKTGPNLNLITSLAKSIRIRFGSLGGIELPDPIREPIREPLDLGK